MLQFYMITKIKKGCVVVSKILKKRINIKRKENINKRLLIQVVFSIILVIAVIATKQFGNSYTGEYLSNAKEKLSETIDVKLALSNIKKTFSNFGKGLNFGFFSNSDYAAPVNGKILKKYGVDNTIESSSYNHGIDIVSNMESVKSISSGKVTLVGKNEKLSNYIVVESGSKKFIYAMFEEIFVSKGDEVKLGDIIGRLNNEERLLHVEIWENGESINPTKLFTIYE